MIVYPSIGARRLSRDIQQPIEAWGHCGEPFQLHPNATESRRQPVTDCIVTGQVSVETQFGQKIDY